MPGQTGPRQVGATSRARPSMEGRAIARPNQCTETARQKADDRPSMEGRAIARPNRTVTPNPEPAAVLQWRAEQLPGQTTSGCRLPLSSTLYLQWRAEQLPGQTQAQQVRRHRGPLPSMEGRAIARPNCVMGTERAAWGRNPFNGGPSNCPAKRYRPPPSHGCCRMRPSMEGRAIARPNRSRRATSVVSHRPSMEGRAIARPNLPVCFRYLPYVRLLQWRAEQLPGQTYFRYLRSGWAVILQWRAEQLPGQTLTRGATA